MKPKLLLHVCCGPCATEVVVRVQDEYEVVGFFYNPNIFPEDEYYKRLEEVHRLSALWHVLVDTGDYDHGRFLELVQGLEREPEGGRRCEVCVRMRLEAAAKAARANGCSIVASTLTIGPSKKAGTINRIGREACAGQGVEFLEADWKKKDGFRRSVELSKDIGMYRQDFCGCEFSRRT
ncbi:MAG: epoxyqueuosine reductase QueH [candidate division WOR-3 bacterium]|nr:MAG: epoxyqueuosine reductase QueH [candidate division WOR-3 bacterium]